MSFSKNEDHFWLSEGHRTMLHFGFRYNPESKEVEPFEPTPPEFIQALGLPAFSTCAQVLPSPSSCPNMWSVARYEPGSGLRSHVDIPQLGPYVFTAINGATCFTTTIAPGADSIILSTLCLAWLSAKH